MKDKPLDLLSKIQRSLLPQWIKNELSSRIINIKGKFNYNSKNSYIEKIIKSSTPTKDLGIKGFYEDSFINKNVLDPRWDSECWLQETIQLCKTLPENFSIVELGAGSGCIILSILKLFPKAQGIASDISILALKTCIRNATRLNVYNIKYKLSSWWDWNKNEEFDIIISNPPYLTTQQAINTSKTTADPIIALDGGEDGLDYYEEILRGAKEFSKKYIILEVCHFSYENILKIATKHHLKLLKIIYDSNNLVRALILQ